MCIEPENELLQQCIASGQVEACQIAQHVAAGEYVPKPQDTKTKPPILVYYDASTRLFRSAADTCAMDNDFQMHYRDRIEYFPKTREEALAAFRTQDVLSQMKEPTA